MGRLLVKQFAVFSSLRVSITPSLRKMSIDIGGMRIKYKDKDETFLEKHLVSKEPFGQFKAWFDEACTRKEILEPNAMCLATVSKEGFPSARFVLCKGFGKDGFKFFTNYESRKARELDLNPNVAATFYWEVLNRSIRIEGHVEMLTEQESTTYFHSRPVPSQIAACASYQSTPIESRDVLCERESVLEAQYLVPEKEVPKPSYWGGYIIRPRAVEFWQGQRDRLHDRIKFRRPKQGEKPDGKLLHEGEDGSWSQAVLPIRFGGLGVRSASSVALPAFLSSAYGSLSLVSIILNHTQILDVEIASLAEAGRAWCDSCPGADVPVLKHIQRAWDTPRLKATHASLLEHSPDDSERARLLAVSASESGHWLQALPSRNVGTVLDPSALRISVCLRLGARICAPHTCPCGRDVDQLGRHGLSCQRSAGRLYRHGTINDLIRRSLATASVPAILEPAGLARDDGKRPDGATLVPWKLGRPLVWDATCVDTFAMSHIQGTRSQAGAAADQAQLLKRRKYSSLLNDYEFAALAVETLGPWSADMKSFMGALSYRLVQTTGDPRAGAYLAQRISIAIQRGNAASVMGSMPRSDLLEAVFFL